MTIVTLNTVTKAVEVFSSARDVQARAEIEAHMAASPAHDAADIAYAPNLDGAAAIAVADALDHVQVISLKRAGIKLDGTLTPMADWQKVIDHVVASGVFCWLDFEGGTAVADDTLDFSGLTEGGVGFRNGTLRPAPDFGRTKALIDCSHIGVGSFRWVRYSPGFENFKIVGNSTLHAPAADDPVGLLVRDLLNVEWRDLRVFELGNTAIRAREIDNCRWSGGEIMRCGYQLLDKRLGTVIYADFGGTTTTCEAKDNAGNLVPGVFTGMVGKRFQVERADLTNQTGTFTIDTVPGNGSSCTVTEAPGSSVTFANRRALSFLPVTGSIVGNTLTLSANVASPADVGREIFIRGAGSDGNNRGKSVLHTTITNVNGPSITLADDAFTDVTDVEIGWAPALVVSRTEDDRDGNITNQFQVDQVHITQSESWCYYQFTGANLFWDQFKLHGFNPGRADFAAGSFAAVLDTVGNAELATGMITRLWPPGQGPLLVCGHNSIVICRASWTGYPSDGFLVSWDVTGPTAQLLWEPPFVLSAWTSLFAPIKMGDEAKPRQILAGTTPLDFVGISGVRPGGGAGVPNRAESYYSGAPIPAFLNNNAKTIVKVPNFYGLMAVITENPNFYVEVRYRIAYTSLGAGTSRPPLMRLHDADTPTNVNVGLVAKDADDVDATDGAPDTLNVLLSQDNKIVILNRSGAKKALNWTFFGGAMNEL